MTSASVRHFRFRTGSVTSSPDRALLSGSSRQSFSDKIKHADFSLYFLIVTLFIGLKFLLVDNFFTTTKKSKSKNNCKHHCQSFWTEFSTGSISTCNRCILIKISQVSNLTLWHRPLKNLKKFFAQDLLMLTQVRVQVKVE